MARRAREMIRQRLEIAHQNTLVALAVQDSSDGIVINDDSGKIEVLNDRAASMLGIAQSDRVGFLLVDLVPDFPALFDARPELSLTLNLSGAGRSIAAEYVAKVGEELHILEVIGTHTTYTGRRTGTKGSNRERLVYAYSLRDITARRNIERAEKEAKEMAMAASNTKTQLIATMSHELMTPLNAILGFSEVLNNQSAEQAGGENNKEYAGYIYDNGKRLHSMVDDVLQVAKLESNDVELEPVEFSPHMLVEDCLASCAPQLEQMGKTIENAAPEEILISGDMRLLRRVINHLLSNAMKFTEKDDTIRVEAAVCDNGSVRIAVYDTGIGVSADQLERLMDPFYQADGSLRRGHEGAGLGLYLAKKCVELHKGKLSFESSEKAYFKAIIDLPPDCLVRRRNAA